MKLLISFIIAILQQILNRLEVNLFIQMPKRNNLLPVSIPISQWTRRTELFHILPFLVHDILCIIIDQVGHDVTYVGLASAGGLTNGLLHGVGLRVVLLYPKHVPILPIILHLNPFNRSKIAHLIRIQRRQSDLVIL